MPQDTPPGEILNFFQCFPPCVALPTCSRLWRLRRLGRRQPCWPCRLSCQFPSPPPPPFATPPRPPCDCTAAAEAQKTRAQAAVLAERLRAAEAEAGGTAEAARKADAAQVGRRRQGPAVRAARMHEQGGISLRLVTDVLERLGAGAGSGAPIQATWLLLASGQYDALRHSCTLPRGASLVRAQCPVAYGRRPVWREVWV